MTNRTPSAHSHTGTPSTLKGERVTPGQMALEVMHEIRNPLEALGYLNFLALQEADNPEQVRKYLHLAQEQITTLGRIATQTLNFAKSANMFRTIDLVELADTALRIHNHTIEQKKIHLVKDLPDLLMAEVHADRMLQVISNLVVNALEALPEGGKLSLRFTRRQGHIHLLVADNGHGIPAEHQERIFERFFTTKGEKGNGLGLAMSKRTVEDHNGKLCFRDLCAARSDWDSLQGLLSRLATYPATAFRRTF